MQIKFENNYTKGQQINITNYQKSEVEGGGL